MELFLIRVLVADDQALVRRTIGLLVDTAADLEVVGETAIGAEAVEIATQQKPDMLLMDIRMPGIDGIQATRQITQAPQTADVRVLILTTFDLDDYVYAALRAGASGFLLKDTGPPTCSPRSGSSPPAMTVSRSCGQRCGISDRHRGAGRLRRCVAERLAGQLAGPAHPRGCGLGVVAELLRDPSGAAARAECADGRSDGLPDLPGARLLTALQCRHEQGIGPDGADAGVVRGGCGARGRRLAGPAAGQRGQPVTGRLDGQLSDRRGSQLTRDQRVVHHRFLPPGRPRAG